MGTFAAKATTYNIGPAFSLTKLSDVHWGALLPGDVVNIHTKQGGYHEIFQISAAGTAASPIIIQGVPDPVTGALPIIDGNGAVTDPGTDLRSTGVDSLGNSISAFEEWGVILVTPRKTGYIYGTTFPEYITIQYLDIRNALYDSTGVLGFTDQHGAHRIYDPFACGIYIEFARHLTIRGCEISFNGNGIFANSKNGVAQSTVDLLIEKNYIHDNGQPQINQTAVNGRAYSSNGFHEHNIYVESVGAVYQYNRFGPLRVGCYGVMIKDRSSGTTIRYNEVSSTSASNIFAALDPQGGSGYIDQQPDYRDVFIYGNVITLQAASPGRTAVIWFGAFNGTTSYPTQHRGTLHFYHNTVVNHQSTVGAFDLTTPSYSGSPNILEKIDCRNNIFYTDSNFQTFYNAFHIVVSGGVTTVDIGVNWVTPGTRPDWGGHPFPGTVNGMSNLIIGDASGLNNPGFVSLAGADYHLTSSSNAVNLAGALDQATLAKGTLVTEQYLSPQNHIARVTLGSGPDLGAFETSAASPSGPVPTITTQPISQTVAAGSTVTFTLAATGASSYQWQKNSVSLSNQNSATLTLANAQISDTGNYSCIAINTNGSATSSIAILTVTSASSAPTITTQPISQTVTVGGGASFSVVATNATAYQWSKDGVIVSGASSSTYSQANVQVGDAGDYRVTVTGPGGGVQSAIATLSVTAIDSSSTRIVNISTRSFAGADSSTQIAGFILSGSSPRKVLIRAGGPYLSQFGVPDILTDPILTLFDGNTPIASNDDWGTNSSEVTAASLKVGATPFATGSKDAALVATLRPGVSYTAHVTGPGNTAGNTIVEVFDADDGTATRLINISTRSFVDTGGSIQIGGFILHGQGLRKILVRAGGPYLSQFGVANVLADPILTIFQGGTQLAQNDDWGTNASEVTAASTGAGVTAFASGSKDSAIVLMVGPDVSYTAHVSGKNGGTGNAIIEVFEVP